MADAKYLKFVLLIVLSALLVAGAFSPSMRKPPPGTRSIESLFSGEHGGGTEEGDLGSGQFHLMVIGAAHTHYLRVEVYIDYRDGTWLEGNLSKESGSRARPFVPLVPHHTQRDRIRVVSISPLTGNLYTALNSFNLSVPSDWCAELGVFSVNDSVGTYSFEDVEYTFDPYVLINLTSPSIPRYIQVPQDERLRELTESITSGITSDYERAEAIIRYLRDNYEYSPGYTETGMPVEEFLFGTRRGGASDFAAAFVLLAREAGLPARLVEGVRIKALPSTQVVTEKNSWFWAEVYFQGAGWLIFDPLSPEDPNLFRPFELSVSPRSQQLNPNDTARLNITIENVAVKGNITLTVRSPLGWLRTSIGAGEHTLDLGKFTSPGKYPVIVEGSAEMNGTHMEEWDIAQVEVPGKPRLTAERQLLELTPGDVKNLRIRVNGTTKTLLSLNPPFKGSEVPFPWTLTPVSGTGRFDSTLVLDVPWRAARGWYLFSVRASTVRGTYTLFIPLRVVIPPNLMVFSEKGTVNAGETLSVSGSTATKGGYIYATLTYGNRLHVVGVTEVRNGSFILNCQVPTDVPPGYMTINVHYLPATGSPVLTGLVPLKVYVRGASRISVPEKVVSNVGTTLVRGFLYGGDGSPITGNLTYYLDGKPLGSTPAINGRFGITLTLKQPGSHILTVRYWGDGEHQAAQANTTVTAVRVALRAVNEPLLGENLKVEGQATGMKSGFLEVLTSSGESANVTVRNGTFRVEVGPLTEIGVQTVGVYWKRIPLASLNFTVLSRTRIRILNGISHGENALKLSALLTDGLGRAVTGATLEAEADGVNLTAVTNGSGVAVFTIPVKGHCENVSITVRFSGAGYYLPAKVKATLSTGKKGTSWWYAVIPVLTLLALIGVHRRKKGTKKGGKGVPIVFPDGIPLFREGEAVEFDTGCEAEVQVDGRPLGRGRRFKIYLEVGEHGIEGTCGENVGRARVRVVKKYSHSVAELYEGCFLRWAESVGLETTEKTPREIVLNLKHRLHEGESLEKLTEIFERARYGREDIERREFIKFYRLLRRTVRGECNV